MIDAGYFKKSLQRDVDAAGGGPVVEVVLLSGHVYRVRAVADVSEGHVTLECYQIKDDLAPQRPRFGDGAAPQHDTFRAVVSYESVAAVTVDATEAQVKKVRPGFA